MENIDLYKLIYSKPINNYVWLFCDNDKVKECLSKAKENEISYIKYMRQVNDHVKQALGIKPKQRFKKDYSKAFVWILLGLITVAIWTTIYNLIF